MTEAILLVLWVGTSLFFMYREMKANKDREDHDWWRSDCKDCLHRIESEFREKRQKISDNYISQYGQHDPREHSTAIKNLKNDYIENVLDKAIAIKGKYSIKSLPADLVRDYKRRINDIADIYSHFEALISEHLNNTNN